MDYRQHLEMNTITTSGGQTITISNGIASVVNTPSSILVNRVTANALDDEEDDDGMDDDGDDSFGEDGDEDLMGDGSEITTQLAAAGPVGVAAAAAIASTKRKRKNHTFETNPSIRKRQQTRLLRKLKCIIDEFSVRVGQQAIVLVATPGKQSSNNFRAFGAKPLEDVIKNLRAVVMSELENALAQQAPPIKIEDPSRHEMPPLVIDGIPTPVEKMTQAQLRAFIPLMLKYSTGRGKPGWGKESTKPAWWPKGVPWANVRMDARTEEDKAKQISWTHALREIVLNCYKYHGREDLLPVFNEEEEVNVKRGMSPRKVGHYPGQTVVQTISNPDGTVSILHVDPNNPVIQLPDGTTAQVRLNSEGTQLISLPDGTTAQVQGVTQVHDQAGVHTLAEVATSEHLSEISGTTEIHTEHGHIIITGEDGQSYPVQVSGHQLVTVPVPASMYQTVVANLQANGEPGH